MKCLSFLFSRRRKTSGPTIPRRNPCRPPVECIEDRHLLSTLFTTRHFVDNPTPEPRDLFGDGVAAKDNQVLVGSKQDSTDAFHRRHPAVRGSRGVVPRREHQR